MNRHHLTWIDSLKNQSMNEMATHTMRFPAIGFFDAVEFVGGFTTSAHEVRLCGQETVTYTPIPAQSIVPNHIQSQDHVGLIKNSSR